MNFIIKIIVSLLCEGITFFIFYHLHNSERAAIIEAGYRSKNKLYKPDPKHLPLWNRLLYWDLCKNAKRNYIAVWFYFISNLAACLAWAFSLILCAICICSMEVRDILLYQLEYILGAVFIWGLVRFIPDLIFLPSEQKRYGLTTKTKKK